MDIVVVSNFCRSLSENDNVRFVYLCKKLSEYHDVELVTSDFIHGTKEHRINFHNPFTFSVMLLHEPGYKKNISIKRFLSHRSWGIEVGKYLKKRKEPDVIYCAVPSLTAAKEIGDYCKHHNVRFIIDIQDLWPEAFQMVFNPPVLNRVIYYPFKKMANYVYRSADEIVAVSHTYMNRAISVSKKCKSGHFVFLGTELKMFDKYANENKVKKESGKIKLAYCGTLGASYDLICVFNALDIIRKKGINPPQFIIMGSGPRKKEFELYAKSLYLDVIFTGYIPYEKMCGILCSCDIVVNPITSGASQSIINKHADYAASGLPVLNTQESEEYCSLVESYQMGYNCKNNDAKDLAYCLIKLIQDNKLRIKMGSNARKCAEEKFDRAISYSEIINLIEL